ncbi:helicase associated domain-containing protein [Streptomyces sp. NBC_00467]|uniref:helicase associated domain-containing protein n=1 Tax=Streptomyces sp. NBC_00467 TaxID=2975752 RepID=UPI002E16BE64
MRAGTMPSERADDLEAMGIVWEPADEAWEENLGAAQAWFDMYGTLAAPVTAAILDKPVGQWLANARKKNGLGKDPVRAARRGELLAAIDPDWRPAWSVDWQRHYATLKGLLTSGNGLNGVGEVPGAMVHGMDLGRWLDAQRQGWARLSKGQRERLTALGVEPTEPPRHPRRSCAGPSPHRAVQRPSSGVLRRWRSTRPAPVPSPGPTSSSWTTGPRSSSECSCPTPKPDARSSPPTNSSSSRTTDWSGRRPWTGDAEPRTPDLNIRGKPCRSNSGHGNGAAWSRQRTAATVSRSWGTSSRSPGCSRTSPPPASRPAASSPRSSSCTACRCPSAPWTWCSWWSANW